MAAFKMGIIETYFDVVPRDIYNYLQPFCNFQLAEIDLNNKAHSVLIIGPRLCGKTTLIEQILKTCPHDPWRVDIRDCNLFDYEIGSPRFQQLLEIKVHSGISLIVATPYYFSFCSRDLTAFNYVIVFWSHNISHIDIVCNRINEKYRAHCVPGKTSVFDVNKQMWLFL
jgi:hypothetical protein